MFTRAALLTAATVLSAAASMSAQDHVPPTPRGEAHDPHGVRVERIRLSTGVELEVAQAGPSEGAPVLFLHGITDSWFSFSLVLDRLPPGIRAIVPSQRGHGDSERPTCCYAVADFAADAVALLDALGVARADVVGHSMGSIVAQRVAIDWPERVSRLVLIGSAASVATETGWAFEAMVQTLTDPVPPDFIHEFQASTVAVPPPAPFFAGIVHESGKLPARVWKDALGGLLAEEARHDLTGIVAPTLVVWGSKDVFFPREEQDALVRAIPDARLLVYEETGHSPNWERPDRFVQDVVAFLRRPVAMFDGSATGAIR